MKNRLEKFIKSPKLSLWKLSIPMILGMSVQAIYILIDTAFIGNWVGWKALTGIGVVFPLLFIIMGITFGLGSGATTVIAQSIGEKNKEKVKIMKSVIESAKKIALPSTKQVSKINKDA